MGMKKMLNEGNQIHNFILCVCETFFDTLLRFRNRNLLRFRFWFRLFDKLRFRFHTVKVAVPTVPVPFHYTAEK